MSHKPSNPQKRRREPGNVDVQLVEIYEDLANENNEIRLKAAKALLSQFTPDKLLAEDEKVEKVLHRLFRGLCSGRKAARIGFSIALTELLSTIFLASADNETGQAQHRSGWTVSKVLEILETLTHPASCDSGQVRSMSPLPPPPDSVVQILAVLTLLSRRNGIIILVVFLGLKLY